MSAKKSVSVLIGGKVYTLSGYESEDYLQKVAFYINGKIDEITAIEEAKRMTPDMKATLIELNIADDYLKARTQIEKYENDIENRDKDIYDLKHKLMSSNAKFEDMEKKYNDVVKENDELKKQKAKLEASLEDALLGPTGISG